MHAGANHWPGTLRGHHADVVHLGAGALGKQPAEFLHAYEDEVVAEIGVRRVVPVRRDDFFLGPDEPLRPRPYLFDGLGTTMSRLLLLTRRHGVDVVPGNPAPPRRHGTTRQFGPCGRRGTPATGAHDGRRAPS
ncbi:hypothetical protein [Streptomyces sp. NPDC058330]|uniref:hypothetical protein n=1 Tax=Streptomyces sp. NPDC058330 TaxID=3346449 RepID=UPI0036EF77AE